MLIFFTFSTYFKILFIVYLKLVNVTPYLFFNDNFYIKCIYLIKPPNFLFQKFENHLHNIQLEPIDPFCVNININNPPPLLPNMRENCELYFKLLEQFIQSNLNVSRFFHTSRATQS